VKGPAASEANVELLLGRLVHDRDGQSVGRIEELRVTWTPEDCVVDEILLGPYALAERIMTAPLINVLPRVLGRAPAEPIRVPWALMDLSDPERPRLRVTRDALDRP
jgi:hypothetical protein